MTHTELKNWKFTLDQTLYGEGAGWAGSDYDDSCWSDVESYTCWETYESALEDYEASGWFRTRYVPQKKDSRQILRFNGVGGVAKVFINGNYVGGTENRYLPFTIDITDYVNWESENVIAVLVDNSFRGPEHLPGGPIVEWVLYGGLTHRVWVEERPQLMLEHVYAAASADGSLKTTVKVKNYREKAVAGTLEIAVAGLSCGAAREVTVGAGETAEFVFETADPSARLWSPEDPNLYDFSATLTADGETDTYTCRIGFRTFTIEGTHIFLNGKEIYFNGANRYDEYAPYGICPPPEKIREDLLLMKSMGMNLVRTHYPQDPLHYEIADEIGIMYMIEVPVNWWAPKEQTLDAYPEFREEAVDAMRETFRFFCNHACWAIWSTGNEMNHHHPAINGLFRVLAQGMRELDCRRIITYALNNSAILSPTELDFCDVISINNYAGSLSENVDDFPVMVDPSIDARMNEVLAQYPNVPHLMTEFGICTIYGVHGDPFEGRYHEEFGATYMERACRAYMRNPNLRGLVIWSWADYRHRRGFTPDNNGSSGMHFNATYGPYGIVTMDRKIKKPMAEAITRLYNEFTPANREGKK